MTVSGVYFIWGRCAVANAAQALARGPQRPATWLLGAPHGVQVWAVDADERFSCSVLISEHPPVLLINRVIAETTREGEAIMWAFERIAEGKRGFHARWRR